MEVFFLQLREVLINLSRRSLDWWWFVPLDVLLVLTLSLFFLEVIRFIPLIDRSRLLWVVKWFVIEVLSLLHVFFLVLLSVEHLR